MGETTNFIRRRSWKTTAAGLITAAAIAARKVPAWAPYAEALEAFGVALLGIAAADHRKEVQPK
jgi:hypothetical protein